MQPGRKSPLVMGIVNVTPDSFSDGGRHRSVADAVNHGLRLLDEGADWLDIGGESTRPGAEPVSAGEELERVVPVIAALRRRRPEAMISVDTCKASVAEAALHAGARMVNDVTALQDPQMGPLCAREGCEVVLMHMRGQPRTMQDDTVYEDMIGEVCAALKAGVLRAVHLGIARDRILVDPGVGFGKSRADNPRLIRATPLYKELGQRVLIGASRKAFIGSLTGAHPASERVHGSVGAALAAAALGADVLRVHDVAATRQALTVFQAVMA